MIRGERQGPEEQVTAHRRWHPAWLLAGIATVGLLVGQTTVSAPEARFAVVNGVDVPYSVFYEALQDVAGREVAERVILEELLRQEAERLGLVPSAEEVDQRIRLFIAERFAGEAAQFAAWIEDNGADDDSLRRQMALELMDVRVRSRGVEVTDEKLRAFFDEQHEDRYDRPEAVKYRSVVLATKEQADSLLADIKAGKQAFFVAASRFSLDEQAREGGGLTGPQPVKWLTQHAPGLAEALAALKPNEVAPAPVEVEGNWYLLLLVEHTDQRPASYEQVAGLVHRDYLLAHAVPEDEFYAGLARKADVSGLPERLRGVQRLFGEPPKPAATPAPAPGGGGVAP